MLLILSMSSGVSSAFSPEKDHAAGVDDGLRDLHSWFETAGATFGTTILLDVISVETGKT
jgi:hypothetical protein